MNFDGSDHQFVVALDKKTGKTVWETKRSVDYQDLDTDGTVKNEGDYRKAFATPHVFEQDGQPILLSSGAKAHYAYDPRTGKELWRIDELRVAQRRHPAGRRSRPRLYPAGFGKAGMLAVKLGGTGVLAAGERRLALEKGGAEQTERHPRRRPALHRQRRRHRLVPRCEDRRHHLERAPRRQFQRAPRSSPKAALRGQRRRKILRLRAGREFKVLAENQFPDGFMASPAVSGKSLYLRTKTALYRIDP